ncbi:MAG: citrate lyase subunit beta / citryl-CoA lyase, partial [Mycobacterium sp.]|nr:citrate lyase subunit beta / citryl-CoA lyase [Mycobacterium sp.]
MAPTLRPRRSALYLPGNNARALEKGRTLPADVLIFDLEDAVGPDAKADSRAKVCDAISAESYRPREIVVRINGLGTDWHDDDLAAVAGTPAHGVLVPKVETGEQVQALAAALDTLDAPESLQLWVMIET